MAAVVLVAIAAVTAWAVSSGGTGGGSGTSAAPGPGGHRAPCTVVVSGGPGTATVGAPTPEFTLPTVDGRCVSLASLMGRPVVVNFWASWCSPCRHEFPLLRAALGRHRPSGLAVVGVSYQDIASDARAFARDEHATWPLLFDDSGRVARVYGVDRVPQTFFVRPDGTLASRIFGIASRADLDHELHAIERP